MNTLSSLPPPSFGTLASVTPVAGDAMLRNGATLDELPGGAPLHVSSSATPRALDDIERDFLAALCENPPA